MSLSDLLWIFPFTGMGFGALGIVLARVLHRPALAIAGLTVATVGILGYLVIAAITAATVLDWAIIATVSGLTVYNVKKLVEIFRAKRRRTPTNP